MALLNESTETYKRVITQPTMTTEFATNTRSPPLYPQILKLWGDLPNELWLRIIEVSETSTVRKISFIKPELFQVVTDFYEEPTMQNRTHEVLSPEVDCPVPYFSPVYSYGKKHSLQTIFNIRTTLKEIDSAKVLLVELYDTDNIQEIWKTLPTDIVRRVAFMDCVDKIYKYASTVRSMMINSPTGCVFPACLTCTVTSQLFGGLDFEQRRVAYPIFMSQAQDTVLPLLNSYIIEIFEGLDTAFENICLSRLKYLRINKTQLSRYKNLWLPELEESHLSMTYNPREEDMNNSVFCVENIYVPKLRVLRLHRASTADNYTFYHDRYWIPSLEVFFLSSIDFYKDGSIDVFNDLDRVISMGVHEGFLENLFPFLRQNKPNLRQITLYDIKTVSNNFNIWKHFENCPIEDLTIGFCSQYSETFYNNPDIRFPLLPTLQKLTVSQMDSVFHNFFFHLSSENNILELEYTIRVDKVDDEHICFEEHLMDLPAKFPHLKKLTLNYYETPLIARNGATCNMSTFVFPELEELMVYSTHSVNLSVFVKGSQFFKFPKLKKYFLLACGDYKNVYKQILEIRNSAADEDFDTMMNDDDFEDLDEMDISETEELHSYHDNQNGQMTSNTIRPNSAQQAGDEDEHIVKQREMKLESINAMNHFLLDEGVTKSNSLINYDLTSDQTFTSGCSSSNSPPSYDFQFEAPMLENFSVFTLYGDDIDTLTVDKYPCLKSLNLQRCFDGFFKTHIGTLKLHKDNKGQVRVNEFKQLSSFIGNVVYGDDI
ncbi:hypothetical protein WICPIJ_008603 [Wickerhamomyces pijperi]|uniref:Uncharacterized protein n=1 Tax=Wickerhamomyces pijperi TaxID=599730 RepID=A0A9P8PW27_WICPI|nr:hypothetical protein WICPIJ_008603 [Wickerhamomyces pijperi]